MPPRRKIHLQLTELAEEDFGINCTGGPIFSGTADGDEDLVCGRCHRILFLALTRDGVFAAIEKNLATMESDPKYQSGLHGRRFPFVAICDCGAINRVWPVVVD